MDIPGPVLAFNCPVFAPRPRGKERSPLSAWVTFLFGSSERDSAFCAFFHRFAALSFPRGDFRLRKTLNAEPAESQKDIQHLRRRRVLITRQSRRRMRQKENEMTRPHLVPPRDARVSSAAEPAECLRKPGSHTSGGLKAFLPVSGRFAGQPDNDHGALIVKVGTSPQKSKTDGLVSSPRSDMRSAGAA